MEKMDFISLFVGRKAALFIIHDHRTEQNIDQRLVAPILSFVCFVCQIIGVKNVVH